MDDTSVKRTLERRGFLQGALGAATGTTLLAGAPAIAAGPPAASATSATNATGAPAAGKAGATSRLDPARPADRIQMHRKLRFRSDDGLVWWWLQGPKYGQVGTTLTPLFTIVVGTLQRVRQRADGGFDLTSLEMVFLADVETGAPLTEWRNPYTGETLPVKFDPLGPNTARYDAANVREKRTEIGGSRLESSARTSEPLIVGDDVFVRDESNARVWSPGRTTPFEVNDISAYHGSLRELTDPAVTSAHATVVFAEVTGWQRWMGMGERPGNLTSRSTGAKVGSFAAMPANWRAMLAEVAPRIAADPVAALEGPEARYTR